MQWQISHENKFPFFPLFTGGNKEAQSSKWLSKAGCGRSVQDSSSALCAHRDGMDPPAQDPSPVGFPPAAAQPGRDTARWGTRKQNPRVLNSAVGTQGLKAFFQVALQSTGVPVQPDEQYRLYKTMSDSDEKPLPPPFSSVCLRGRTSEPNP